MGCVFLFYLNKGACPHRTRSVHSMHMTRRNLVFSYNWQYFCLYRPCYTPTTLDSLIMQSRFFSSRQLQRY